MQLTQSQAIIASDLHRFRVVNCGRRFGKTVLSSLEMIGKAVAKKDRQICYVAPTYQQARDICWNMLKKTAGPVIIKVNESRLEISIKTIDGGVSTIWLRGWESIETLRGQFFDFIVLDEVAMYRHFWLQWQEVIRPTLTDRKGEVLFLSTPKGFNHFYDLFNLERTNDSFKSFHFTSYDNPNLPVEELEEAKTQMTEDRFAQEYLADFRKTEGLVYKEFDRRFHTYDNLPDIRINERLLGVDFGYTNPAAMVLLLKDYDGSYWLEAEWYKTGQTNEQITEKAKTFGPNAVYPDPEAPEKIADLIKAGLNCREVNKGKDSIRSGIDAVRELFKQGKLKINKRCVNVITELETYSYPESNPDKNEEELPVKKDDHAMDALRYVIMMNRGNVPISQDEDLSLFCANYF